MKAHEQAPSYTVYIRTSQTFSLPMIHPFVYCLTPDSFKNLKVMRITFAAQSYASPWQATACVLGNLVYLGYPRDDLQFHEKFLTYGEWMWTTKEGHRYDQYTSSSRSDLDASSCRPPSSLTRLETGLLQYPPGCHSSSPLWFADRSTHLRQSPLSVGQPARARQPSAQELDTRIPGREGYCSSQRRESSLLLPKHSTL